MKNRKKTLGWAGFYAAILWLYFDYQAVRNPSKIWAAIFSGWATVLLTIAHIWA